MAPARGSGRPTDRQIQIQGNTEQRLRPTETYG